MYILHGVADCSSQVIHMVLAELGVPFQFKALDWDKGDFNAPGFLAMNPFGQVPVLETPDGPMFETAAILLYLTERHVGLAPQPQDKDRAKFLICFVFVTNSLHHTTLALLHPERAGSETAQHAIAEGAFALAQRQLAALETIAAQGYWWLSGDRPSVLSLYISMLLRWIKAFAAYAEHSIASQDFPALHRMAKAIESRPTIQAVLQAEGLSGAAFSNPPYETPAV